MEKTNMSTKIISQSEQSNIELLTKYCSKLRKEFDYPYFFNWTFSTNHIDSSDIGEMEDCEYFCFYVGRYPDLPEGVGRSCPVEKMLFHGPANLILNGRALNCLASIKDQEDKKEISIEEYMEYINEFLKDYLIISANNSIKDYNKMFPNQEPYQLIKD